MKTTFIYFLKDPTDSNKGYVGKTDNPGTRIPRHITECRDRTHARANWLKSLSARGFKPTLEIVDEVSFDHWPQCEVAYIEFFLEQGFKLVNGTPGGEDPPRVFGNKHCSGHVRTVENRNSISRGSRNKKKPNNTSGHVGVHFEKGTGKWRAAITINRRTIHSDRFVNFSDAVFVRRLLEEKYFA